MWYGSLRREIKRGEKKKHIRLYKDEVYVGRDPKKVVEKDIDAQFITVNYDAISILHFVIEKNGDKVIITNKSGNKTRINDDVTLEIDESRELKNKDYITIGSNGKSEVFLFYDFDKIPYRNEDEYEGLDDIKSLKLLGEGSFGKVYKTRIKGEDKYIALKIISKIDEVNPLVLDLLGKDIKNIITINDVIKFREEGKIGYEMDLYDVDLSGYLSRRKNISREEMFFITKEILLGLEELEKLKIVHRDLKMENIFLNTKNGKIKELKLGDLGGAVKIGYKGQIPTARVGTVQVSPPEFYSGKRIDNGFDMFSLGATLIDIGDDNPFFPKEVSSESKVRKWFKRYRDDTRLPSTSFKNKYGEKFYELVSKMIKKKSVDRIFIRNALEQINSIIEEEDEDSEGSFEE